MREPFIANAALAAAVLLTLATSLPAAEPVDARLLQARYVALGYDLGDRFLSEADAIGQPDRVTSEDRKALDAVRGLVEKWDRYVIVLRPAQADVLVAVRAGRRVQAATAQVLTRSGRSGGRGATVALELSSPDDMLSVYERSSGGGSGTLLWRAQRRDGFTGPFPELVEQFKADVQTAAKKP